MTGVVDLNSDLGEGFGIWRLGDDAALLRVVSSANVACGFHAGDPSIMRAVCEQAAANGVAIGAQVSYPDLRGFGRRFMEIDAGELSDAVTYQLGALDAFARAAGSSLRYVKPHGALYHATVGHDAQAAAVVRAVASYSGGLAVLGLPGSSLLREAERRGLQAVQEGFADRAYRPDGGLVPRSEPGAVLHDAELVARRVVQMAVERSVQAADGSTVRLDVSSICVHGDTPGAAEVATQVRDALEAAGVAIAPFVSL